MRITKQQLLETVERICADDFCEVLDMRMAFPEGDTVDPDLKVAYEKLSLIYRMTHSMNREHTCYRVHGDWRSEAEGAISLIGPPIKTGRGVKHLAFTSCGPAKDAAPNA